MCEFMISGYDQMIVDNLANPSSGYLKRIQNM